jgi:acyl carrier protein
MHTDAVYDKLTPIFRDVFDDDELVLRPDLTADDVPDWDSLSHIRLILTIQQTFGIKFSAAQATNPRNVGELVALIQWRLEG